MIVNESRCESDGGAAKSLAILSIYLSAESKYPSAELTEAA
jgi:hypothetical protein